MTRYAATAVRLTRGAEQTVDMTGRRVGALVVVRKAPSVSGARWLCRCDCGVEVYRSGGQLRQAEKRGVVATCGCGRKK